MEEGTEENKILEKSGNLNRHIKDLKEIRKAAAPCFARKIEQKLLKSPEFVDNFGEDIIEGCSMYISKCIDVSWMIAVHQQVPYIQWEVDCENAINDSIYRRYNSDGPGSTVDYLVWPAILVYPDGPLICKGVVEVINE
ncbi:hypothetical protein KUTeg_024658 [Tegillarca granosa]|uniref:Mitochondria-eating protein C-terminal domain-containing protein n=1 Tax=Tegillarca granosa TaxID=220873 RepID=A0ABQ9E2M9_TEGGR|nr:hypothetical protein KUTeg_024658 [Tegillarca granosa]